MQSAAYIWAKTINYLETQLSTTVVSAWFDDAEVIELNDSQIIIYSPSDFRRETIRHTCKSYIEAALQELYGLKLELVVWNDDDRNAALQEKSSAPVWKYNPQFSFSNFIAGEVNRMPLKAAMHVAEHLGDSVYNPLYFYGAPGVGKTHLLIAIANQISVTYPEANVVYVKGEQFTNELIQAIFHGTTEAFRKKYREADVLLVDDIQFIAGKEATQEEFFHTFNGLFELHKQIVLVSDRKPSEMATLEDRLKSRFGAGILMQLQVPDADTRREIVRMKATSMGIKLDGETTRFIADKLCDNVRQIEGALRKVKAFHDLSGMELNLTNIARTVEDLQTSSQSIVITPELVIRNVCRYYGIQEAQIKSQQRSKNIAEPRHVAMYLIRQLTKTSFPEIGKIFGRDHGTVHHGVKKIEESLHAKDSRLENIIKDIQTAIEEQT